MKDGAANGLNHEKEVTSSDIDFTIIDNVKTGDISFIEASVVSGAFCGGCSSREEKKRIMSYHR